MTPHMAGHGQIDQQHEHASEFRQRASSNDELHIASFLTSPMDARAFPRMNMRDHKSLRTFFGEPESVPQSNELHVFYITNDTRLTSATSATPFGDGSSCSLAVHQSDHTHAAAITNAHGQKVSPLNESAICTMLSPSTMVISSHEAARSNGRIQSGLNLMESKLHTFVSSVYADEEHSDAHHIDAVRMEGSNSNDAANDLVPWSIDEDEPESFLDRTSYSWSHRRRHAVGNDADFHSNSGVYSDISSFVEVDTVKIESPNGGSASVPDIATSDAVEASVNSLGDGKSFQATTTKARAGSGSASMGKEEMQRERERLKLQEFELLRQRDANEQRSKKHAPPPDIVKPGPGSPDPYDDILDLPTKEEMFVPEMTRGGLSGDGARPPLPPGGTGPAPGGSAPPSGGLPSGAEMAGNPASVGVENSYESWCDLCDPFQNPFCPFPMIFFLLFNLMIKMITPGMIGPVIDSTSENFMVGQQSALDAVEQILLETDMQTMTDVNSSANAAGSTPIENDSIEIILNTMQKLHKPSALSLDDGTPASESSSAPASATTHVHQKVAHELAGIASSEELEEMLGTAKAQASQGNDKQVGLGGNPFHEALQAVVNRMHENDVDVESTTQNTQARATVTSDSELPMHDFPHLYRPTSGVTSKDTAAAVASTAATTVAAEKNETQRAETWEKYNPLRPFPTVDDYHHRRPEDYSNFHWENTYWGEMDKRMTGHFHAAFGIDPNRKVPILEEIKRRTYARTDMNPWELLPEDRVSLRVIFDDIVAKRLGTGPYGASFIEDSVLLNTQLKHRNRRPGPDWPVGKMAGHQVPPRAGGVIPPDLGGDALVPQMKKALYEALVHPTTRSMTESITRDLTFGVTPPLFDALNSELKEYLTSSISSGLYHTLSMALPLTVGTTVPEVIESVLPAHMVLQLTTTLINQLTRSVTHSLSCTLIHTLGRDVSAHYYCYYCQTSKRFCTECNKSASNEDLFVSLYYGEHFSSFYSDYYSPFYAKEVFQLMKKH
jgi:hypothetical protein